MGSWLRCYSWILLELNWGRVCVALRGGDPNSAPGLGETRAAGPAAQGGGEPSGQEGGIRGLIRPWGDKPKGISVSQAATPPASSIRKLVWQVSMQPDVTLPRVGPRWAGALAM